MSPKKPAVPNDLFCFLGLAGFRFGSVGATAEGVFVGEANLDGGNPFEFVEFGDQRVGGDVIIVNQFAGVRVARAIGDTPTHGLGGTNQDLALNVGVLEVNFSGVDTVAHAPGFDDHDVAVAHFGFLLLCELDRDDLFRKCLIEHDPKTFAHAGGIHDEILRLPDISKGFEFAKGNQMADALPCLTMNDAIGGGLESFEGGQINIHDAEGCAVAPGVTHTFEIEQRFICACNIDREGVDVTGYDD